MAATDDMLRACPDFALDSLPRGEGCALPHGVNQKTRTNFIVQQITFTHGTPRGA